MVELCLFTISVFLLADAFARLRAIALTKAGSDPNESAARQTRVSYCLLGVSTLLYCGGLIPVMVMAELQNGCTPDHHAQLAAQAQAGAAADPNYVVGQVFESVLLTPAVFLPISVAVVYSIWALRSLPAFDARLVDRARAARRLLPDRPGCPAAAVVCVVPVCSLSLSRARAARPKAATRVS